MSECNPSDVWASMAERIAAVGEESGETTWTSLNSIRLSVGIPASLRRGSSSRRRASASSEVGMSLGSNSPCSDSSRSILEGEEGLINSFLRFLEERSW